MPRNSISLGRIFGISIFLDYSWFLIFVLFTWILAVGYYPAQFRDWSPGLYWLMGAVTTIMLFVSVLIHELGHSAVSLRYGLPVKSITLFLFGGISQIGGESPSAAAEFFIAVIGPVISIILAGIFYGLERVATGSAPLEGLLHYLVYINAALAVFNLIPGYPLDGGRVFRAFVWAVTKNMQRATRIAANVGRFFGFLFIFLGIMQIFSGNLAGGVWIILIGWFLESAAASQASQERIHDLLAGYRVSQAMDRSCSAITPDLTLQEMVESHVLGGNGRRCFLVKDKGDSIGLMTLHQIREVPKEKWAETSAGQVMLPLDRVKYTTPDSELLSALQEMDRDGVNQLPVIEDNRVVGLLSREDVLTFLEKLRDLGV